MQIASLAARSRVDGSSQAVIREENVTNSEPPGSSCVEVRMEPKGSGWGAIELTKLPKSEKWVLKPDPSLA